MLASCSCAVGRCRCCRRILGNDDSLEWYLLASCMCKKLILIVVSRTVYMHTAPVFRWGSAIWSTSGMIVSLSVLDDWNESWGMSCTDKRSRQVWSSGVADTGAGSMLNVRLGKDIWRIYRRSDDFALFYGCGYSDKSEKWINGDYGTVSIWSSIWKEWERNWSSLWGGEDNSLVPNGPSWVYITDDDQESHQGYTVQGVKWTWHERLCRS
jgi:hypothetical protein